MSEHFPNDFFGLNGLSFFDIDCRQIWIARNEIPVLNEYSGVASFERKNLHDFAFKHCTHLGIVWRSDGYAIALDFCCFNDWMGLGAEPKRNDALFYWPREFAFIGCKVFSNQLCFWGQGKHRGFPFAWRALL